MIKTILQSIIYNKKHDVLLPIPQYPLYSAIVSLFDGTQVPYYSNEENDWSLEITRAKDACIAAKEHGIDSLALVVINPAIPTGQCLTSKEIENAFQLAKEQNLIILADEVYQKNVYGNTCIPFILICKVLTSFQKEYNNVELYSFHNVSKGILGECGIREGYMELTNIASDGVEEIYKLASINLCSNTIGQITPKVK